METFGRSHGPSNPPLTQALVTLAQGWGGSKGWMGRWSPFLPTHRTLACSRSNPTVATAQSCCYGQTLLVAAILIVQSWWPTWMMSDNVFFPSLASPWSFPTLQLALCRADLLQFYQLLELEEATIKLTSQLIKIQSVRHSVEISESTQ